MTGFSLKTLFPRSPWQWCLGLTLAALCLWTINLGGVPFRDWDEGYHAFTAREVYRTGNWWHLTNFGQPYFAKPPLPYWVITLGYHLTGQINEWTTRLPLAVVTALGVPLLYGVGRELFKPPVYGLFIGAVYLTLLPVVRHGRLVMLDGLINTCLIGALFCLLRGRSSPPWALGVGLFLACIALTKGVLVFALGGILILFLLVSRQWETLKNPYLMVGIVLGLVLTGIWYDSQLQKYGQVFFEVHILSQNLDRLSDAVEGNSGPPWYYLIELLKYGFPWLLFLPGGLQQAWQERRELWAVLVGVGTVSYLGLISLMGTKLPWYILPYYPFFALTVGVYLTRLWQEKPRYSRFWWGFLVFLAVDGLGGMVYFWLADPQVPLILMAGVLSVTMGGVAWLMGRQDRRFLPVLFVGMYGVLSLLMLSRSWNWEVNEQFPVRGIGAMIRENTPPEQVVYTSFAYHRPSLDYYSDRSVQPAAPPQLQEFWASGHYVLLDAPTLATFEPEESVIIDTVDGFTLLAPRLKHRE
ncbi:ArnT family glycosyltransferase [Spirulina subsalsa]|uniref:ArnT family glycosyltransferase n=1 Tax=Spirulina subsalsa TaxID=54311 RepID=UPI00030228D3|nr:glycosyltransferase family 39 protein [Spirulina subsalsa]